jgi:hypothetical protein
MGNVNQDALMMNIVNLDLNASMMNAKNHARLTKIVMTKVIMAHIVTLITKFVWVNVQKMQTVLEDTLALKKGV